jgi:hypothetical protein
MHSTVYYNCAENMPFSSFLHCRPLSCIVSLASAKEYELVEKEEVQLIKEYKLVEKEEVQLIDVNQTNESSTPWTVTVSDEQTLSWTATHYGQKLNSLDSLAYTCTSTCTSRIRHYFKARRADVPVIAG